MGIEDIQVACNTVKTTAGQLGMTKADFGKATDLLQRYGDDRSRLFDQLLALLDKTDASSILSDWKNLCETGRNLLEPLEGNMPKSPMGDEGLKAVGLNDFSIGEKKIWEENAGNAYLALTADGLSTIYSADLKLIQKLNDDMKTVLDGGKEIESLLQENMSALKKKAQEVTGTMLAKAVPTVFSFFMKDQSSKQIMREWGAFASARMADNLKAARRKGELKQLILQNLELFDKAKEQLGLQRIDEMYKKGEDFARSLADIGENGDYRALDWQRFGNECIRRLADRRDRSIEQSKKVFEELLPSFTELNNQAFKALTNDPSMLASWKSDMQDNFRSTDEAFAKGNDILNDLADGPFKEAARATFDEMRNTFTAGAKALFDQTKDAEDELNK